MKKIGIAVLVGVVIALGVFMMTKSQEGKSVEQVTGDVFNKFEVQSIQVGETEPIIWVDVYDINDATKIEKYLKKNLSEDDLEKYDIDILSRKGIDY